MSPHWTNREIDLLRRLYPELPAPNVAAQLPRRSLSSVQQMAYRLGLKNGKGRVARKAKRRHQPEARPQAP